MTLDADQSLHMNERNARERGVTLVELMIAVSIIGIVGGIWMGSARARDTTKQPIDYATMIASELDGLRLRASATRRWQRATVQDDRIEIDESVTEGMNVPVAWEPLRDVMVPHGVRMHAAQSVTSLGGGVEPAEGAGIGLQIMFRPDGTATAATIYVTDDLTGDARARVAVVRATGFARALRNW